MKLKMKALAAAVALVAAGSANAAFTNSSAASGSSVIFEAWDTVSNVGMVQSLGSLNYLTGATAAYNFNLDATTFAAMLGTDTAGTGLNWHVFSSMQNDTVTQGFGLLTTIATGGLPGPGFRADSGALGSLQISLSSHIDLINAAIGTATFGTIPSSNSAYGANNGGGYYGNLFGNSAKAGFGGMDFYQYANNMDTFALIETKLAGPMVLSSTGNLAVSAVPLPAAVWLFGSGLLGLVGIGRRRKQA